MQPALFRKLSLFAELDDRELAAIAGVAKTRRYAKDDVIFHADEPGDVFAWRDSFSTSRNNRGRSSTTATLP